MNNHVKKNHQETVRGKSRGRKGKGHREKIRDRKGAEGGGEQGDFQSEDFLVGLNKKQTPRLRVVPSFSLTSAFNVDRGENKVNLPFTPEEFLNVFKIYNQSIWPLQILAYLLGVLGIYLVLRQTGFGSRAMAGILGIFWIWNGAVYHIGHFSSINKMAYLFGSLFIIQGLMFLYTGMIRRGLNFQLRLDRYSISGAIMILYAMVVYPILGYIFGHSYPAAPVFGVAPCPTTIFTFGLLLWTSGSVPKSILIIPLIWSAIGFTAALHLGIYEDVGLLAAGGSCLLLIWMRDRKGRNSVGKVRIEKMAS